MPKEFRGNKRSPLQFQSKCGIIVCPSKTRTFSHFSKVEPVAEKMLHFPLVSVLSEGLRDLFRKYWKKDNSSSSIDKIQVEVKMELFFPCLNSCFTRSSHVSSFCVENLYYVQLQHNSICIIFNLYKNYLPSLPTRTMFGNLISYW